MFFKCLLLLFVLTEIEGWGSLSRPCDTPRIQHGRFRMRQRSKMVKFICFPGFTLAGNKYATCRDGEWDVELPVCVKPGCTAPSIGNGIALPSYNNAVTIFFCLPRYKLVGSAAIHCDGRNWNTTTPSCVSAGGSDSNGLSCDFESTNICGWTQDELHDFDWRRLNKKTPSFFLSTGPSYDHTYGKDGNGYYMYIESTSRLENDTARLLSPVYDSTVADNGCFRFYYHMFGKTTGGLRVYQKPDNVPLPILLQGIDIEKYLLFEKWGNLGDTWYTGVVPLKDFGDEFQIVIEGIRGTSYTSDIAIDDVAILQGDTCKQAIEAATTPAPVISDSCLSRCDLVGAQDLPAGACACSARCVERDGPACCADFLDVCVFASLDETSTDVTVEQPQTEKLIAESTIPTTVEISSVTPPPTREVPTYPNTQTSPKKATTKHPTTIIYPETVTFARKTLRPIIISSPRPVQLKTSGTSTTFLAPKPTVPAKKSSIASTTPPVLKTTLKSEKTGVQEKKTTRKIVMSTKAPSTSIRPPQKTTTAHDHQKAAIERKNKDALTSVDKKSESSGYKTTVTLISGLVLCIGAVWLVVWGRGERGRATLARLRGRVRNDPDVQYLNSAADDDIVD